MTLQGYDILMEIASFFLILHMKHLLEEETEITNELLISEAGYDSIEVCWTIAMVSSLITIINSIRLMLKMVTDLDYTSNIDFKEQQ